MSTSNTVVSIHPYFKVRPGKLATCKTLLRALIEKTAPEAKCLYYDFTIHAEEIFCREAYADADAALVHVENVAGLITEMLKHAELTRLEVHGPAAELAKLKGPMAQLKPVWFVYECGVKR